MCYLCLVLQRQGSEEGKKNKEERNYNAGKLPIIVQNENHKQNWKKKLYECRHHITNSA